MNDKAYSMHSNGLYTRFLPDEEATLQLGEEWSKQLSAPLTIYLEGGLGHPFVASGR